VRIALRIEIARRKWGLTQGHLKGDPAFFGDRAENAGEDRFVE